MTFEVRGSTRSDNYFSRFEDRSWEAQNFELERSFFLGRKLRRGSEILTIKSQESRVQSQESRPRSEESRVKVRLRQAVLLS